jgi:hypothetical protein
MKEHELPILTVTKDFVSKVFNTDETGKCNFDDHNIENVDFIAKMSHIDKCAKRDTFVFLKSTIEDHFFGGKTFDKRLNQLGVRIANTFKVAGNQHENAERYVQANKLIFSLLSQECNSRNIPENISTLEDHLL